MLLLLLYIPDSDGFCGLNPFSTFSNHRGDTESRTTKSVKTRNAICNLKKFQFKVMSAIICVITVGLLTL
ncbi:MAG: hypothetical protein DRI57_12365 [Deltaproteobacteria bacterium]|nr:MAG: hypothetical protein DRI57_12365 [Deltaproteobacteria bacterium]